MNRVLVVEDHEKLLRSLRRGLEAQGFEVLVTETGEAGLEMALTRNVDLMILDIMLPGRNGFEILTDLRRAGFHKPVLILTAKNSSEDRRRGEECGADGFLAKPFAFGELLLLVEQLIRKSAMPAASKEQA